MRGHVVRHETKNLPGEFKFARKIFFVPDYILEYTYRFYRYFFDSRLPDGFSRPTQSR